jgi:hypothetical protein
MSNIFDIIYLRKRMAVVEGDGQAGILIEVTPKMIEAGVCALDLWRGAADSFELVERVYIAMAQAPPSPKFSAGRGG